MPGPNVTAATSPQAMSVNTISADNNRPSIWSTIGTGIGKAFAFPFRTVGTVANVGLFMVYSAGTLSLTGLAAAGGAAYGTVKNGYHLLKGSVPEKSLSEYSITAARKTFNFLSRLYYELPKCAGKVVTGVVLGTAAIVGIVIAAKSDSGSNHIHHCYYPGWGWGHGWWLRGNTYHTHHHHHYHGNASDTGEHPPADTFADQKPSYFETLLSPYKFATDIGVTIMDSTSNYLNK